MNVYFTYYLHSTKKTDIVGNAKSFHDAHVMIQKHVEEYFKQSLGYNINDKVHQLTQPKNGLYETLTSDNAIFLTCSTSLSYQFLIDSFDDNGERWVEQVYYNILYEALPVNLDSRPITKPTSDSVREVNRILKQSAARTC